MSENESYEMFEMVGNDSATWLHQAQLLKTSADTIYEQMRLTQQNAGGLPLGQRSDALLAGMQSYMMLLGFCIENLIKGILVSRTPGLVNKKQVSKSLLNHNVIKLIPADILLSDPEKELLTRLQRYAIWAGRYPLPTNSDEFHQARGEFTLYSNDKLIADALFFQLARHVVDND